MADPTIVPTKFSGDHTDYLKTKTDRQGVPRLQYTEVTVPATTATTVVVGLVPFNKGARLSYGGTKLAVADLDTGTDVTLDIGYVYKTGSSETSDPNAFASAVTTAQAGGLITFDEVTGLDWVAEDDGWIAVTIGGGATTTEGDVYGQVSMAYDGLDSVN